MIRRIRENLLTYVSCIFLKDNQAGHWWTMRKQCPTQPVVFWMWLNYREGTCVDGSIANHRWRDILPLINKLCSSITSKSWFSTHNGLTKLIAVPGAEVFDWLVISMGHGLMTTSIWTMKPCFCMSSSLKEMCQLHALTQWQWVESLARYVNCVLYKVNMICFYFYFWISPNRRLTYTYHDASDNRWAVSFDIYPFQTN